jgi:nucleoside-diphosphate-sugar epimerase
VTATLRHREGPPGEPSRVVVLGAGGFLGRSACASLEKDGVPLVALGSRDLDLADPAADEALAGRLAEGDALVFLSALTPDKGRDSATLMRNLAMARAVAAVAKKVKLAHLVYASSDAVYPFTEDSVSEDSPAAPTDLYGAMHRTRELILAAEAPAPLAVLRFTAVYGPGDTHNSYGPNRFVRQALADGVVRLFGEGEETRDHLWIGDAVAVLRRVVAHRSTGLLNVASGGSTSFRSVADAVAALVPGARVESSPRQSAVTHRRFEPAAMRAAFPELRFTPLAEGLEATVAGTGAGRA